MAKKKNTGINLLKGIQGSRLAVLITVLVILFAIPLTVTITRQQQNLEQEASVVGGGGGGNACGKLESAGGKCVKDHYPYLNCRNNYNGYVLTGYCPGDTFCCIPSGVDRCKNIGHCQYTTIYCASGNYKSGLCPGPSNYKCCLDK